MEKLEKQKITQTSVITDQEKQAIKMFVSLFEIAISKGILQKTDIKTLLIQEEILNPLIQ